MSHSLTHYVYIYMVYYNKIALIQQIWYFHVFSWSLICSPNVRKKMQEDVSKDISKDTVYRKKQSRINARKGVRRYVRRMIADMSEYICQKPCQRICQQFQQTGQDIYLSLYIYIYYQNACEVKEMVRRYVRISDKMLSHTVDGCEILHHFGW